MDYIALKKCYEHTKLADFINDLPNWLDDHIKEHKHGDYEKWEHALNQLPHIDIESIDLENSASIIGKAQESSLKETLKALMPWRKGPFTFGPVFVDTEWRSNLKWERVSQFIDLKDKHVLDVGSGNGYYGFRMLGKGAKSVLGIDPNWLFLSQFKAFNHYAKKENIFQLPIGLEAIKEPLNFFDVVFSMGVFYHRKSPIDHLTALKDQLNDKGQLVLETLIVDETISDMIIPKDRYAQMRNVWFIPSLPVLITMLERVGFKNVRCVDQTYTTVNEQRRTEWMDWLSLKDFLNEDQTKTIEGYPLPLRAVILADK